MNLLELSGAVKQAEVEAKERADRARASLANLKSSAKAAATPWRIVSVGAISGFLMGRRDPAAGPSVGGRLFGTIAQSVITALGASATAGAAASSAADAAAAATVNATVPPFASNASVTPGEVASALTLGKSSEGNSSEGKSSQGKSSQGTPAHAGAAHAALAETDTRATIPSPPVGLDRPHVAEMADLEDRD